MASPAVNYIPPVESAPLDQQSSVVSLMPASLSIIPTWTTVLVILTTLLALEQLLWRYRKRRLWLCFPFALPCLARLFVRRSFARR